MSNSQDRRTSPDEFRHVAEAIPPFESLFPPGVPVIVRQTVDQASRALELEIVGVVVEWAYKPTGSWFAHGKGDKLWLMRLKLKKLDGEFTWLVIDNLTRIARLEAQSPSA